MRVGLGLSTTSTSLHCLEGLDVNQDAICVSYVIGTDARFARHDAVFFEQTQEASLHLQWGPQQRDTVTGEVNLCSSAGVHS